MEARIFETSAREPLRKNGFHRLATCYFFSGTIADNLRQGERENASVSEMERVGSVQASEFIGRIKTNLRVGPKNGQPTFWWTKATMSIARIVSNFVS